MKRFTKGDWVIDAGKYTPQIGQVRESHELDGLEYIDLVMYDYRGRKLGRVSPVMGGPRTYEPMCDASYWTKVHRPKFPLTGGAMISGYRDLLIPSQ